MADTNGYLIGPKLLAEIRAAVQHYANIYGGGEGSRPRQQDQRHVSGILNSELVSATSFASSPATATMAVWQKDTSGNMVDSGQDIAVVNRMLKISLPAGTIAQAEWIDGEWRIYAADCA
jgi:hypothetical protein